MRITLPSIALLLPALLLCAATPATRPSTRPATGPTEAEIRSLISQLTAPDWKAREKAQADIIALGVAARPALERILSQSDEPEVRTRLETALRAIEKNDHFSPTLVTLATNNTPAHTVFADLGRQAGTQVDLWPEHHFQNNPVPVTIHIDRQPFWVAVRSVCEKVNVAPQILGGRTGITLGIAQNTNFSRRPYTLHGPFMIVASGATRTHNADFGQPGPIVPQFNARFQIFVDPKLRALKGPSALELKAVVDENGNSLVPPAQPGVVRLNAPSWDTGWLWDVNVPLQWTPTAGKRMATFNATARFLIEASSEKWRIDQPLQAKEQTKTIGNTTYTFLSARKIGGVIEVKIAVQEPRNPRAPQGDAMTVTDYQTLKASLTLTDAQGRSWTHAGGGGGGGERLEYAMNFSPRDGAAGEPDRLIWRIPTELRIVEVPVEFKDLPIP